jgi:hypothetical protein
MKTPNDGAAANGEPLSDNYEVKIMKYEVKANLAFTQFFS